MKKIRWIGLCLVMTLFLGCSEGEGDRQGLTLAILDSDAGEPYKSTRESMLATLAEAGFVDGDKLEVIHHTINNDEELGKVTLAGIDADVYFVNGTIMARAARAAPAAAEPRKFVFACVTDPVGEDLVEGFDVPPTGDFTGVSFPVPVQIRFNIIKKYYPHDRTTSLKIGLIHADMPQSQSYRQWIEDALDGPTVSAEATAKKYAKLSGVEFFFRQVPFYAGADGIARMTAAAEPHVMELNDLVDLFVSPNDQMGANEPFARMVWEIGTRPLIGLGRNDVLDDWGAMASIYPSTEDMGRQAGNMVIKLLEGASIATIPAETPKRTGYALDVNKAESFGLTVSPDLLSMIRPEDVVQ